MLVEIKNKQMKYGFCPLPITWENCKYDIIDNIFYIKSICYEMSCLTFFSCLWPRVNLTKLFFWIKWTIGKQSLVGLIPIQEKCWNFKAILCLLFFARKLCYKLMIPTRKKILIKSFIHEEIIGRTRSAKYFFAKIF